jgi:predicted DNA-binding ribbon-helix-helix protein
MGKCAYAKMRGYVGRDGHLTSLRLEPGFWQALRLLAISKDISLQMLLHQIEGNKRPDQPLASALRTYAIDALLELLGQSTLTEPPAKRPPRCRAWHRQDAPSVSSRNA